jgi:hypothetical protein
MLKKIIKIKPLGKESSLYQEFDEAIHTSLLQINFFLISSQKINKLFIIRNEVLCLFEKIGDFTSVPSNIFEKELNEYLENCLENIFYLGKRFNLEEVINFFCGLHQKLPEMSAKISAERSAILAKLLFEKTENLKDQRTFKIGYKLELSAAFRPFCISENKIVLVNLPQSNHIYVVLNTVGKTLYLLDDKGNKIEHMAKTGASYLDLDRLQRKSEVIQAEEYINFRLQRKTADLHNKFLFGNILFMVLSILPISAFNGFNLASCFLAFKFSFFSSFVLVHFIHKSILSYHYALLDILHNSKKN